MAVAVAPRGAIVDLDHHRRTATGHDYSMDSTDRSRIARVPFLWIVVVTLLVLLPLPHANADSHWEISIVKPVKGESVRNNEGNLAVEVATKGGGAIVMLLNGKQYGSAQSLPSFKLEGVERGEHTLEARLLNSAGKVLASSRPVQFYLGDASALAPGRK
jgi:hypothetical protein